MILLLDNYDSFTYNLYQAVREAGAECRVFRNDKISLAQIQRLRPSRIILSPGPGRPEDAGIMLKVIKAFHEKVPMLGVCLGHQAIALAFGAKVVRAKRLMHGKTCRVSHDGRGLFRGLSKNLTVMRYHSLVADDRSLPECLEASSKAEDGSVMALRHRQFPLEGVQFHPESIMTQKGPEMIRNFLKRPWLGESL